MLLLMLDLMFYLYIDKHLLKELNLPLINNYFILEGETADFTTIPPLILGEGLI